MGLFFIAHFTVELGFTLKGLIETSASNLSWWLIYLTYLLVDNLTETLADFHCFHFDV